MFYQPVTVWHLFGVTVWHLQTLYTVIKENCDPVLCWMHLWTKFATFEEFFINQFWSSVTVWHTWKFKESLLVHKRSWRWPNIFFVTLWICTWVGKIVFSLISKHLKLDFSMSHSDKQSRCEQISPRTERQKDRKIERLEVENTMNRTQKTFTRPPMNS